MKKKLHGEKKDTIAQMYLVCTYSIDFNVGIINPDKTHHGEEVLGCTGH